MIYLDNAATTSPKPETVRRAVNEALLRLSANPGRGGHSLSVAAGEAVYAVREKLAAFFGCPKTENVVFTKNCTEALNIAIKGTVTKGSHVLASVLEHNSVLRPLEALRKNGVISYDLVPVFSSPEATARAFEKLIRPSTRVIVCTHVSNVFGCVLPIAEIGEIARKHSLSFIVDAAQSAGVLPVNMQSMSIDALCMPGHKGLYGPMGTGCLLLNEGADVRPLMQGGTGSFSANREQPAEMPDRLESGTLPVSGIIGLGAGVDFVSRLGVERISRHEKKLIAHLMKRIESVPRARAVMPAGCDEPTLLSLTIEGIHSEDAALRLDKAGIAVRGGYHCAYTAHEYCGTHGSGTVRVSPGAFNSVEDIDMLVKIIGKMVNEQ